MDRPKGRKRRKVKRWGYRTKQRGEIKSKREKRRKSKKRRMPKYRKARLPVAIRKSKRIRKKLKIRVKRKRKSNIMLKSKVNQFKDSVVCSFIKLSSQLKNTNKVALKKRLYEKVPQISQGMEKYSCELCIGKKERRKRRRKCDPNTQQANGDNEQNSNNQQPDETQESVSFKDEFKRKFKEYFLPKTHKKMEDFYKLLKYFFTVRTKKYLEVKSRCMKLKFDEMKTLSTITSVTVQEKVIDLMNDFSNFSNIQSLPLLSE